MGGDTEKYLRKYKSRAGGNRAASQLTPDASMFPSANTASAGFSIPALQRNVNSQQIPSIEAGTVAASMGDISNSVSAPVGDYSQTALSLRAFWFGRP